MIHTSRRSLGDHRQWDILSHHSWGVPAHSTQSSGAGSCDDDSGVEIRHVRLTLANGLPDVVGGVNLSYADPADVDVDAHEAGPETLVVHNADEVLYRSA
jgi:hypothetical protein